MKKHILDDLQNYRWSMISIIDDWTIVTMIHRISIKLSNRNCLTLSLNYVTMYTITFSHTILYSNCDGSIRVFKFWWDERDFFNCSLWIILIVSPYYRRSHHDDFWCLIFVNIKTRTYLTWLSGFWQFCLDFFIFIFF